MSHRPKTYDQAFACLLSAARRVSIGADPHDEDTCIIDQCDIDELEDAIDAAEKFEDNPPANSPAKH